jgi:tRNA 5-methylaminomethyl-2-thiouridine biosynthesis bifunctional protein
LDGILEVKTESPVEPGSAGGPREAAVVWEDGGPPRSRLHGDIYFSREDGLAESRAVFLAGCDLPAAWTGRRGFTVAELGFGTGLNIAALLDMWDGTRPPGARLSIFTIEANPLTAAEARRALGAWPELDRIATLMTSRWAGMARGFHRIDLPEFAATIDVAVMEAADALRAWNGAADAWFLDGFAPALNPDIWRGEVIDLLARRSAPGARAATYTVASAVRRELAAAGFTVERRPGHGRKRERLEAHLPGGATDPAPPRVAIIGAGVAGAALARAFRALGLAARVFDDDASDAKASGAPAALMAPRLDAGLGPGAALFAQAARRAIQLYGEIPEAVIARGALQLPVGPKDPGRFAAIAASDLFEPGAMTEVDAAETGRRLGQAGDEPRSAGLDMAGAMVVRPAAILQAWLGETTRTRIAALEPSDGAWRLRGEDGELVAEAEVICVAAAMGSAALAPGLSLTPVRGQSSFAARFAWNQATAFGAYAIPTRDLAGDGVLFGATHDRGETTSEIRPADRDRNLLAVAAVLPSLAARLSRTPLADWSAIRATTTDYLPLAGPAPGCGPGLLVLTGLGSRGFCLAPLLAEHLAAVVMGHPSPLPSPLAELVDPARFAARAARKGRPRS